MRTIFFSALLIWPFLLAAQAPAQLLGPEIVGIHSATGVDSIRGLLVDYIWSGGGMPDRRVPEAIDLDIHDPMYELLRNEDGNLARIDRYRIDMNFGFQSVVYHFHPLSPNGKLFIYHAGHGWGFPLEDRTANGNGENPGLVIPYLIMQGYSVLAFCMPLQGNPYPLDSIPGYGFIDWIRASSAGHEQMFRYLPDPYSYFFTPLTIALNYIEDTYSYTAVYMIGLSGGGWTTMFYSAIDKRIRFSFPVAGSVPLYLRVGREGLGDAEQGYDYNGIYGIANYTELYILGATGEQRGQLQINNRYDDIAFYGHDRDHLWVDSVRLTVERLKHGRFNFFLDETHSSHKISIVALSEISKFIQYYESHEEYVLDSAPSIHKFCAGDTARFEVESPVENLFFQWQVFRMDDIGYVDLQDDEHFSGTQTSSLQVVGVGVDLNGARFRCKVSGDHVPTTTSYPFTIFVAGPPEIVSQPVNVNVCISPTVSFEVQAAGGDLEYQWQQDDGEGFYDIFDTGAYDGIKGPTLTILTTSQIFPTTMFRCKVTSRCFSSTFSSPARLEGIPYIVTQPEGAFSCPGDEVTFSVNATGTDILYQWQRGNGIIFEDVIDDDSSFSGASSQTLSILNVGQELGGAIFRCRVSSICGHERFTEPVTLRIQTPTLIDFTPLKAEYCYYDRPVLLEGSPAGGYFYGTGVDQNTFFPDLPEIGSNTITYVFIDSMGCAWETSQVTTTVDCEDWEGVIAQASAYPNPSYGPISVDVYAREATLIDIHVITARQRMIVSRSLNLKAGHNPIEIDLTRAGKGIYLLLIKEGAKIIATQRLVKL